MKKNSLRMSQRGFTLIELMITVIVIAILAGIAYPAYTKFVQQSRRSDAVTILQRVAALQEKYYSQCQYYTVFFDGSPVAGPGNVPAACSGLGMAGGNGTVTQINSDNNWYQLSITAYNSSGAVVATPPPAVSYLINATPIGSQVADTTCNSITLNSQGARGATDNTSANTTSICWKR